ncbi:carbohydrate sulfotransferase 1 [Nematostella vectensis]|uniref:carbohydrate sulfotransferase 1 n=1 Tax=Nematostella vectensis TaxID=45351 RepID=UPI0020772301|nr:carbohydrate sulfotransferase 1 [Nematostella vectensis]
MPRLSNRAKVLYPCSLLTLFILINLLRNKGEFDKTRSLVSPKAKKEVNLLIVTQGRSGSTFLGQILDMHPNVFYIYEPLRSVEKAENILNFYSVNITESYCNSLMQFLDGILNCRFKKSKVLDEFSTPGHFRYSSRVLRSPPLCKRERECGVLDADELNKVCRVRHKATVVKILDHRIPPKDFRKTFAEALEGSDYQSKVLYLFRDPRAIIASMDGDWIGIKNSVGEIIAPYNPESAEFSRYARSICAQMEESLGFAESPPSWHALETMLLRYEDLVMSPEKVVKQVFEFIGMDPPLGIESWLDQHMNFKQADLHDSEGKYLIRKNSTLSLNKWRLKSSAGLIRVVEKHCKHLMDRLGYKTLDGSRDLQKRLTYSLIREI